MKQISLLTLVILAIGCTPPSKEEIRLGQYKVQGQRLYMIHCGNCHLNEGQGLAKVYPPIAGSDYLEANLDKILCGMRNGMKGEIVVNGVTYNQEMPGFEKLTDLEVAEIATYIYNSWGNDYGLIDVSYVTDKKANCN